MKRHGASTGRAKDFRRYFILIGLSRGGLLCNRIKPRPAQALLQSSQLASNGSAKETVIAHLHKSMGENMLKETLKETDKAPPHLSELD